MQTKAKAKDAQLPSCQSHMWDRVAVLMGPAAPGMGDSGRTTLTHAVKSANVSGDFPTLIQAAAMPDAAGGFPFTFNQGLGQQEQGQDTSTILTQSQM